MKKQLILGLSTTIITLGSFFGLGELATRVFLKERYDTQILERNLDNVSIKSLITPVDDPNILYKLKTNQDSAFHKTRVITDSSGVRVDPKRLEAEKQGIKVALLGDFNFIWMAS